MSPSGEGVGDCVARGLGRTTVCQPVVDLAAPTLPTGPEVAAACVDREENHDPGGRPILGLTNEARLENAPSEASGFSRVMRAGSGASVCPAC